MLPNNIKIAFRSLKKTPVFTTINVLGLTVGLACCMLIALYIFHETHFDRHHVRPFDLYRIGTTFINLHGDEKDRVANTLGVSTGVAGALKNEFGEIEQTTKTLALMGQEKTLIRVMDKGNIAAAFNEEKGFFADSSFFELFQYDFLEGNPSNCLREPGSVVISDELAMKFFGNARAEGRILNISSGWFEGGKMDCRITGVFKMPEHPTSLRGRFFMSMNSGNLAEFLRRQTDMTRNNMFATYIRLRPGAKGSELEAKIPAFIEKHMANELKARGEARKLFAVPMPEVHLFDTDSEQSIGKKTYLYILGSIALLTLIIACVNFMNLSTARSSKRASEVGARKSVGASQGQLVRQFLGESILVALAAFTLAFGLVQAVLPAFNNFAELRLSLSPLGQPVMVASFLALALATGFLAGAYPAFYLSSFKPVEVLRGNFGNRLSAVLLRKSLVVFQFVISAGLILASFVIGSQLRFLQNQDLGFQKEQQIVLPLNSEAALSAYHTLKSELAKDSRVASTGASLFYPGVMNASDSKFYRQGQTRDQGVMARRNWVDADFLKSLDFKVAAGRLFSPEFPGDTASKVVINETAARKFGFLFAQDAVNQQIKINYQNQEYPYEVVGVVQDFHFEDFHEAIAPYVFELSRDLNFNYLLVHAQAGANLPDLLATVNGIWKQHIPGEPLEYTFLDEDFQKNYKSDLQMAQLIGSFTGIAILISCLGLFGLAAFAAEQRTKEIGVRKVLGASVAGITALLAKDFLKLVLIAIVIAAPIAYYLMNQWLSDFAYRIEVQWWMFAEAAATAVAIAFLTVSFQSIKAALANPVKSLRND